MPTPDLVANSSGNAAAIERRQNERVAADGEIWLVDGRGQAVAHGRIVDASPKGLQIRVPVGYGVAPGQRYDLHTNRPGTPPRAFGLTTHRPGTIIRTRLRDANASAELEVGLQFD